MKTAPVVSIAAVACVALLAFYFVDIDMTDAGALPDVDVSVESGELPEMDVKTGSVSVGTDEKTVSVPDVDVSVDTEEVGVTLPTVDVKPATE